MSQPSQTLEKAAGYVRLGYTIVIVVSLFIGLFSFLVTSKREISSGIERDYGEGIVLWQARTITSFQQAYKSLETYPYVVYHYPPVYHYASRLVAALGPDLLEAGRIVSVLSTLGCVILIGGLVFTLTERHPAPMSFWHRGVASFFAGVIILHLEPSFWMFLMRVDMLGLFLTFAGLYLFIRGDGRWQWQQVAFLCFVLAVYTKQTLISAPLACLASVVLISPWRAIRMIVPSIILGLAIIVTFSVLTNGQFTRHLFLYNANPADWRRGTAMFTEIVHGSGAVLILGLGTLASVLSIPLVAQGPREQVSHFLRKIETDAYFRGGFILAVHLLLALLTTASAAKIGANLNYFLEFLFACCVFAGLGLAHTLHRWSTTPLRLDPVIGFGLVATGLLALEGMRSVPHLIPIKDKSDYEATLAELKSIPGPVYSEQMTIVQQAGKDVSAECAILTPLADAGLWDEKPFAERIRSKWFSLVLVTSSLDNREHFTPRIREAIESSYVLRRKIGRFQLLFPKTNP